MCRIHQPPAIARSCDLSTSATEGQRRLKRHWQSARLLGGDDYSKDLQNIRIAALAGYQPDAPDAGRLWIESWHFGIRDAEMRADTRQDYADWRRLAADAVRLGIEQGRFGRTHRPETVAVLAIALVDGMGIPLALADPEVTIPGAVQDVLAALRGLLGPGS